MLIYDADCGFCMWSLRVMLRLGATCRYQPAQGTDLAALGLTEEMALSAAWFVAGQERHRGHEAIAQVLRSSRYAPVRLAGRVTGSRALRPVSSRAYAWVAAHRHRLPGATSACKLPPAK